MPFKLIGECQCRSAGLVARPAPGNYRMACRSITNRTSPTLITPETGVHGFGFSPSTTSNQFRSARRLPPSHHNIFPKTHSAARSTQRCDIPVKPFRIERINYDYEFRLAESVEKPFSSAPGLRDNAWKLCAAISPKVTLAASPAGIIKAQGTSN